MGFPITPVHSILPVKKKISFASGASFTMSSTDLRISRLGVGVLDYPGGFVYMTSTSKHPTHLQKRASLWNSNLFILWFSGVLIWHQPRKPCATMYVCNEVWSGKSPTLRTLKNAKSLKKPNMAICWKITFSIGDTSSNVFFFPLSCYFSGVYVYINTYINISSGQITMTPKAE